jgi:hypothetical protein
VANSLKPIYLTSAGLTLYVVVVALICRHFQNLELINRFGAFLSAIGALLVVYQALIETRMEDRKSSESRTLSTDALSPMNAEVASRIFESRAEIRTRKRTQIVLCIAMIVFIGEIMHGWGDIIYQLIVGNP